MRHDIFERAITVMKAVTSERRRYKELEEETGIPATNWQSAAKRKQRPTAHMIEALSRRWPKYAFWLATGITDPSTGHTAAGIWTAGQPMAGEGIEETASRYFDANILLQDLIYDKTDAIELHAAKKYSDLDAAITDLAFKRRLKNLTDQFKSVNLSEDTRALRRLIAELAVERAQIALKESQELLRVYKETYE